MLAAQGWGLRFLLLVLKSGSWYWVHEVLTESWGFSPGSSGCSFLVMEFCHLELLEIFGFVNLM